MPVAGLGLLTPEGWLLALLALVPLAGLLVAVRRERAARALLGLAEPARRSLLPAALAAAAIPLLLAAAAAQPVLRTSHTRSVRSDAEVLVVLDTSRSMRAAAAPAATTRFDRARTAAAALRDSLPGIRVGLVSFTDRVLPHLFPTVDEEAFARTLRRAVTLEAPPPGGSEVEASDLGQLGALGTHGFFTPGSRRRVAVVITDGESRPIDTGKLRRGLATGGVELVLVRDWQPGDRVFAADGQPEPGYRPDAASGAGLATVAAEVGARLVPAPDGAAAATAARTLLASGPTVHAGTREDAFRLAPWLALAALAPLALLWRARR
jgi:hypothetical protein